MTDLQSAREEFEGLYPEYLEWIHGVARRMARGHGDITEDLVQVGSMALWDACREPPSSGKPRTTDYRRKRIIYRMIDALRRDAQHGGSLEPDAFCESQSGLRESKERKRGQLPPKPGSPQPRIVPRHPDSGPRDD